MSEDRCLDCRDGNITNDKWPLEQQIKISSGVA